MKWSSSRRARSTILVASFFAACIVAGIAAGRHFSQPDTEIPSATYRMVDARSLPQDRGSAVVLYSMTTCDASRHAREWLTEHGFRYAEKVIDESTPALEEARRMGAKRTPLLLIGKYQMEGFDPEVMERLLAESGSATAARH